MKNFIFVQFNFSINKITNYSLESNYKKSLIILLSITKKANFLIT